MKYLLSGLLALFLLLQYRLWLSDEGMREAWQLADAVETQRAQNAVLTQRNAQLRAEVDDLKKGLSALEERARHDLGMVAVTETFYQVVDTPDPLAAEGAAAPQFQAATSP